jgi:hypothetical protein
MKDDPNIDILFFLILLNPIHVFITIIFRTTATKT